ncbi:UNVERIFIED_CONTAM: hypothetical protein Sangu_3121900 [Sesamum angustifolium]|uniref:Uncharacterized protein n=1 Tax=Sesamum angustifolium TaxID=2727405 RepID=A0AAW2K0L6_9LAMI
MWPQPHYGRPKEPIRKVILWEMTNELRSMTPNMPLEYRTLDLCGRFNYCLHKASRDSVATATNEYRKCKPLDDSSQPASGVYQRMWEKLISRKGVNPSKTIIETSGKYNRVWMMGGSKPEEVREWERVASSVPFHQTAETRNGSFYRIKAASEEAPLVSAITEDDISTRRAWVLWVCLTEMDKVKYPFKIFSNKVNGSFLLNSMIGKSTEFAESIFEKKRMLIWDNKLPATEATRMKACNMLHVGQWHNHVCLCCEKQEKPLFRTKIRVTQKKPLTKTGQG